MPREPRPVTFWCEVGSHTVTELRRTGNPPRYCAEHIAEAKRNMAKQRVAAHRARKAQAADAALLGQPKKQQR